MDCKSPLKPPTMKKLLSLLTFAFFTFNSFAVISSDDIQTANYLASKKIIKDWSSEPKNYRFDDYIARSEIMGMVLAMTNVTRNTTCRGDFADVPKSNTDWVCRTIETAADKGYINAQASLSKANRKARPYDHITRAEALGILMKAVKDEGGWAGYSYYWSSSLPNPDSTTGYKDIYSFGAEWQAWVFYDYIKKVLEDDKQLYINPRANDRATRREVFDFAATIDKKINNNSSLVNTSNIDLDISFNAPSDAVVSTAKSRKTIDGISINELIVTPLGVDATSVYFPILKAALFMIQQWQATKGYEE